MGSASLVEKISLLHACYMHVILIHLIHVCFSIMHVACMTQYCTMNMQLH